MKENSFVIQTLQKANSPDLESRAAAIAGLAREIWSEHYTPIIGAEQVEYMLDKFQSASQIYADIVENDYTYLSANDKKSGKLVGYCGIVPNDDCLLLSKCYVHRDYRGNGIASAFFNEVVSMCKMQYGFGKVRLTVNKYNTGSIEAYKKLGFVIMDSVKTDIGGGFFMDDYIMECSVYDYVC